MSTLEQEYKKEMNVDDVPDHIRYNNRIVPGATRQTRDNGRYLGLGEEGARYYINLGMQLVGSRGLSTKEEEGMNMYDFLSGFAKQPSIGEGLKAVGDGWKSGSKEGGFMSGIMGALGIGGKGGGLFGASGMGLLSGLGGAIAGYTAKRDKEKAYAHKRKTEGRAPMGFNVFEDASPEDYLAGIPQREQGIPNYYNPAKLPRSVSQTSTPRQGMLSQANQNMSQPNRSSMLGSINQKRVV